MELFKILQKHYNKHGDADIFVYYNYLNVNNISGYNIGLETDEAKRILTYAKYRKGITVYGL